MEKIVFSNVMGSEGMEMELNKLARVLNETGLIAMINTGGTVDITTAYQKIEAGGPESISEGKGLFSYDQATHRLNIHSDGIYAIRLCGSVEFQGSAELELSCFINDVEYSPITHPQVQGRGAGKPVMVSVITTIKLVKGDYVEMMAKGDQAYTLTMLGNNISIEKKLY